MRFSIVGFIVGAICALIFYAVFTALIDFSNEALIAGLIALLIWGACTFAWPGPGPGPGPHARV